MAGRIFRAFQGAFDLIRILNGNRRMALRGDDAALAAFGPIWRRRSQLR